MHYIRSIALHIWWCSVVYLHQCQWIQLSQIERQASDLADGPRPQVKFWSALILITGINTPFLPLDMKHLQYDNPYYSAEQFSSLRLSACFEPHPLLCDIYKALHNVTAPQRFIRPQRIIQSHFSMHFLICRAVDQTEEKSVVFCEINKAAVISFVQFRTLEIREKKELSSKIFSWS